MFLTQHEYYHIYNRGNNKQPIFFKPDNYIFFLKKMRQQLLPVADIIAYCLMPNHFHLIILANESSIRERESFGGKPMQEFAYRLAYCKAAMPRPSINKTIPRDLYFSKKQKPKH
jgi:putative transposase